MITFITKIKKHKSGFFAVYCDDRCLGYGMDWTQASMMFAGMSLALEHAGHKVKTTQATFYLQMKMSAQENP